jgi:hypothetical protein
LKNYDEIVFEALAYRRYVGADLKTIRGHAWSRDDGTPGEQESSAALARLEEAGLIYQVGAKWFLTPGGMKQAKGSAFKPGWMPEDSMILLALLLGGRRPAKLVQIIGTVDYINHAIPTLEEMHGALNRLKAGRLIGIRRDAYVATEKALGLYEKVKARCRRSPLRQLSCLERLMECPCCGVDLKRVGWRIKLDEESMEAACSEYLKKF